MFQRRPIIVCVLLLFFSVSVTGASLLDDASEWSRVEEPIPSCDPSGVCTTEDTFDSSLENAEIRIDSGPTGYCGMGGMERTIDIPPHAEDLVFISSASKDAWANHGGILIDDEWVFKYETDNPEIKTWTPSKHRVSIEEYAGETVPIRVVIEDVSEDWCDMHDHSFTVNIYDLRFEPTTPPNQLAISLTPTSWKKAPLPFRLGLAVLLLLFLTGITLLILEKLGQ